MLQQIFSWLGFNKSVVLGIDSTLLEQLAQLGQNAHPNETLCFLTGQNAEDVLSQRQQESVSTEADSDTAQYKVITEYYLIPGTKTSPTKATVNTQNIPLGTDILGSFHTHPNGNVQPSKADLNMFHKYPINIIMGAPYSLTSWNAYKIQSESYDKTTLHIFDTKYQSKYTNTI